MVRKSKNVKKSGSARLRNSRRMRRPSRKGSRREFRLSIIIEEPDGKPKASNKVFLRVPVRKSSGSAPARLVQSRKTSEILSATAHPIRLAILHLLLTGPAGYSTLQHRTQCKAGPLYHHVAQLRLAGLILPKQRDVYELSTAGRNVFLCAMAMNQLADR